MAENIGYGIIRNNRSGLSLIEYYSDLSNITYDSLPASKRFINLKRGNLIYNEKADPKELACVLRQRFYEGDDQQVV
ncbi:hypothetical protein J6590_092500 [Homalodisca vitripennis]|nr:hypothetical protein J6590_092500 [Homalodisca vitripennis]